MIHWNTLAEFLAMGRHGPYVWGSLLVMVLLMVAEPMLLLRGRKRLIARLGRQYRAEAAERRQAAATSQQGTANRSND